MGIRPYVSALGIRTGPQSVAGWEKGRPPSGNEFTAILEVLGVDLEEVTRERVLYFGGTA